VSGARLLGKIRATDEVLDMIASVEMQRQEMEKNVGLAASCSSALRKLHEVLDHEKEALQLRGADAGHADNVAAVMIEIERVKALSVSPSQGPPARAAYPRQRNVAWQNAHRSPARNKGRRTMGRAGGR